MSIAVDAMGGDFAPSEIIKGAKEALSLDENLRIILVGEPSLLEKEIEGGEGIEILPASQTISVEEKPTVVRKKQDSSLMVALRAVKEGRAQAVITAGHTGAAVLGSLLTWGKIKGISRPAIAAPMPCIGGRFLLLDAGANVDCKPEHLLHFAIMGNIYASQILHIQNPRIGLLNIGEETGKGNRLTTSAYQLLEKSSLNFIGNVEGKDIFSGKVDVVVCDGFVGNVVLKSSEGLAQLALYYIKELGMDVGKLIPYFDYAEYGGAPILGVPHILIKSHGRSRAKAIRQAILVAKEAVEMDMIGKIISALSAERS
ncbi:phosphate acyltransferase PlsX [bacterium]|nr:phosphate acyltransferase PlsX [bacterium]